MKVRLVSLVLAPATLLAASFAPTSAPASASGASAVIPLLRVGMAETISSLDPTVTNGAFSNIPESLALEQLQQLGPNGQLDPVLAESVTQPNPTTYDYHLRPGVKFWDGDPLTAADVVFSLDYYRRPGARIASEYSEVKSITEVGPSTVVVTLKQPNASWPDNLANTSSGIFERKFFLAHSHTYGQPGVLVMGTGPWEIDSFDPTSGVQLSANAGWWSGRVPVERISIRFFSGETSEALALRAGEIDLAPLVLDGKAFAATSGADVSYAPSCQNAFVTMPTQTAPWSDVHVRRAVADALDRDNIIAASGYKALPTYTLIAPSQLRALGTQAEVNAALATVPTNSFNLALAKREMAESAYPKGFTVKLETFNYGSFLNVDQVVQAELQKIGITVQIDNIGENAWFAAISGPDAGRPFTYTTAGGCGPDPSWQDIWLGKANLAQGELNVADYAPPQVDKLIAAGLATSNPAMRLAIYTHLLQRLATDVPYIPLYIQDLSYAASNKFVWPSFNQWWGSTEWALGVKAAG